MAADDQVALGTTADFLEDIWYCVGIAASLKRRRMLPLRLAGQSMLLARGDDGLPFAIRDLCPHRGVPLRFGRFDGREVECCYHGWRFGADGRCTHIPSLVEDQKLDISRIRCTAWPVRESQGLIWVFLGEGPPDREPPQVPDFAVEVRPSLVEHMTFGCHSEHAVIGLMDPAHGPYVHRSWFWRSQRSMHEKAKRFGPSDLGFTMLRHTASSNSFGYRVLGGTPETEISFQLPGVRIEHIRVGRHRVCGLTAVTPVTQESTQVIHAIWWTVPWLTMAKPLLQVFARQFLAQDRRMVGLQAEGLREEPRLMLIRDADTQARWYQQLKREWVRSRAAGRPFENPVQETTLRWRT